MSAARRRSDVPPQSHAPLRRSEPQRHPPQGLYHGRGCTGQALPRRAAVPLERTEADGARGAGPDQVVRVCVVGGSGMLGCEVVREAISRGWEVWAPSRGEFDLTDPVSVAQIAVAEPKFDACINCAAYTAVDRAETERDEALALNALGPAYLATACLQAGTRLVHVSTDFVFDGTASVPYRPGDPTHPLSVYGESKLEGEGPVLGSGGNVVRTSWLFGPERGGGFPGAIVRAARAGRPLRVVADQVGTP
ncbi:MAG: sugar nucleotide-binding protein, partial [Nitrospirae bacterium]|nr:sugar nucleotide-binding protein [Fimbriimonadaceae bacterium]